jgi:hypothetical protein
MLDFSCRDLFNDTDDVVIGASFASSVIFFFVVFFSFLLVICEEIGDGKK